MRLLRATPPNGPSRNLLASCPHTDLYFARILPTLIPNVWIQDPRPVDEHVASVQRLLRDWPSELEWALQMLREAR